MVVLCLELHTLPGWTLRSCLTIKLPFCLLVDIKSFKSHILRSIASIFPRKSQSS